MNNGFMLRFEMYVETDVSFDYMVKYCDNDEIVCL